MLKPVVHSMFVTCKSMYTGKAFSFSEHLSDQVCFCKQMLQSMKTTILTNSISHSRNPVFNSHSSLNGLWSAEKCEVCFNYIPGGLPFDVLFTVSLARQPYLWIFFNYTKQHLFRFSLIHCISMLLFVL